MVADMTDKTTDDETSARIQRVDESLAKQLQRSMELNALLQNKLRIAKTALEEIEHQDRERGKHTNHREKFAQIAASALEKIKP